MKSTVALPPNQSTPIHTDAPTTPNSTETPSVGKGGGNWGLILGISLAALLLLTGGALFICQTLPFGQNGHQRLWQQQQADAGLEMGDLSEILSPDGNILRANPPPFVAEFENDQSDSQESRDWAAGADVLTPPSLVAMAMEDSGTAEYWWDNLGIRRAVEEVVGEEQPAVVSTTPF